MPVSTTQKDLAALLSWYRDMGVDCAVGETAVDWLARPDTPPGDRFAIPGFSTDEAGPGTLVQAGGAANARPARPANVAEPAPPARPAAPAAAQRTAPPPPGAAETSARSAARAARTLEELGAALAAFDACPLKATAKNLCFFRGAAKSRIMFIGEAPGREEDLAGKPFVGPAGQLLDKMLAAIGLDEPSVHITNIVYWRPPGNRTPTPQEAQTCRPFLERQIELVAPKIIVALGGAAAKALFDVSEGIMRTRGRWREQEFSGRTISSIATLHPAYLLRTPAAKRDAWRDLLSIKARLANSSEDRN